MLEKCIETLIKDILALMTSTEMERYSILSALFIWAISWQLVESSSRPGRNLEPMSGRTKS